MQPAALQKLLLPMHRLLLTPYTMPSRPPSTSSPSPPPSPGPAVAATTHAPAGAMPSGAGNNSSTACLPADQSCFALPSSRRDAAARACCTATSYLVVLGISFGSLLAILIILCAIRWYLVHRSASREAAANATAAAAAGPTADDKKRSAGLDADAIAALPEFVYTNNGDEDEEERECAACLAAMADGEAARRLPRCMHVFHRGCVDVWLREHSTCPVCRGEVVISSQAGEGCAEKETDGAASRASTSTARRPPHMSSSADDDGERDLEAQL